MTLMPMSAADRAFRWRWGLADGDAGPISLPKILLEPDGARRPEAERYAAEESGEFDDIIGGYQQDDTLQGGSAGDRLSAGGGNGHWFSLPTTGDDEEIVVTGRKWIPDTHKHVLAGGRYYENPHFNPPFNPTLDQVIAGSALTGAGLAFPPLLPRLLTLDRGRRSLSTLEENARRRGDHVLADYWAEPNPSRSMGEHVVPRRWGKRFFIPAAVINSRFNVLKPAGITRGGMAELHHACDNNYGGGKLPRRVNQKGWSAQKEGLEKYDPIGWAWRCTTPGMKVGAGLSSVAAGMAVGMNNDEE